jgi:hypothetical protein
VDSVPALFLYASDVIRVFRAPLSQFGDDRDRASDDGGVGYERVQLEFSSDAPN